MAKFKTEIILKGEFTTVDVSLEGNEIPLREIADNEFRKLFTEFSISGPLDIHVRLKGWIDMKWEFSILINDSIAFSNGGLFDARGFVTFTEHINV